MVNCHNVQPTQIYLNLLALPVNVWSLVEQPLDQGGVLGHTAHVEDVLPVVLLTKSGQNPLQPFQKVKILPYKLIITFVS